MILWYQWPIFEFSPQWEKIKQINWLINQYSSLLIIRECLQLLKIAFPNANIGKEHSHPIEPILASFKKSKTTRQEQRTIIRKRTWSIVSRSKLTWRTRRSSTSKWIKENVMKKENSWKKIKAIPILIKNSIELPWRLKTTRLSTISDL